MKKKVLSILLSLCMVLAMMPMAAGVAWADETQPAVAVEDVTFSYAYDVQRRPAYPVKGNTIGLSGLDGPIINSNREHGNSEGSWTLSKAGTYKYITESGEVESTNIISLVSGIVSEYASNGVSLIQHNIIIYELKNRGIHYAYGVIVAYDHNGTDGYALFQGDILGGSGAGYYLSTNEKNSATYDVTANFDLTSYVSEKSIALEAESLDFGESLTGYASINEKTVTVKNNGSTQTGALTVALSGSNADSFTLNKESITSIAKINGKETFTVKPKDKLPAGNYSAIITVSGDGIDEKIETSFKVKDKGISLDPSGTYVFPSATVGYGEQSTKAVKITLLGEIADLAVSLPHEAESAFECTEIQTAQDKKTFEVKTKTGLAAGTYTAAVTVSGKEGSSEGADISQTLNVSFTVNAPSTTPSTGTSYYPTIQKPTVITDDGAEATLNYFGDKLTIKVKDDYELEDVLLNGVSQGKVTELSNLKSKDKVEVKTNKKQEEVKEPTKEEIMASLGEIKLIAKSELVTLKNGKKGVRVTWYDKTGKELEFDGVEIYRSMKKRTGFGTKPFYATKGNKSKGYYLNTKNLKVGKTYYYKVRGYRIIDGKKYFTKYSTLAYRTNK